MDVLEISLARLSVKQYLLKPSKVPKFEEKDWWRFGLRWPSALKHVYSNTFSHVRQPRLLAQGQVYRVLVSFTSSMVHSTLDTGSWHLRPGLTAGFGFSSCDIPPSVKFHKLAPRFVRSITVSELTGCAAHTKVYGHVLGSVGQLAEGVRSLARCSGNGEFKSCHQLM